MKIALLYSDIYFVVSSFHPRLIQFFGNFKKDIYLININVLSLSQIEQELNEVDLLIIDHSILMCSIKDVNKNFSNNIYLKQCNKSEQFYVQVFKNAIQLSKVKKCFWFHGDPHGLHYSLQDRIEALGQYYTDIINNCTIFILALQVDKYLLKEEIDRELTESSLALFEGAKDNLLKLIGNNVVIECPHCVSATEQYSKKKKWDICIPGASYLTRQKAIQSIQKSKLKIAPFRIAMVVKSRIEMIMRSFLNRKQYILFGYKLIQFLCASSKISYVDGSALRYFVRKFVEIPMYNTAMLCYPSKDMHDYGFVDGENCVYCLPDEAGIKAKELIADKNKMKRLRENALQNVLKNHTTQVRAQQLIKALQLAAENKLKASYFKDGKYIYETI